MPSYTIDMSGENYENKESLFPQKTIIPASVYDFEVQGLEMKKKKVENTPYFVWTLKVDSGDEEGKVIQSITTAIKGKRWLLKQALHACGIEPNENNEYNFNAGRDIIGKKLRAVVDVVPDNWTKADGTVEVRKKNLIKKFLKIEDSLEPPIDTAQ